MRLFLKVLVVASFVFCQSCVTTNITSNKLETYNGKVKEIVIFLYGEQRTFGFFNSLHDKLSIQFEKNGIKAHFHSLNVTSFENEAEILEKSYKNVPPDCVMTIKIGDISNSNFGPFWMIPNKTSTNILVNVYDPTTHVTIWKAQVLSDSQSGLKSIARKTASAMMRNLKADKML
jgi:hypothetical protein